MNKHISGPWTIDTQPSPVHIKAGNLVVATCSFESAQLIASAPELLEAAKFALICLSAAATRLGDDNLYASARAELREAIAKAEGREK